LTAQDHAPHAFEQLEQMLSLRLPAASFDRLADLTTRHQLVDCLETLGLRYIALDLTPLD
jgi:hypothetical protein